jgi:hypothetical protein
LAGSAAYAFADTFGWRQGLDERFGCAHAFYAAFLASMGIGMALDFLHVGPIKALFWTAIINGLLAPFLLLGILIIACDRSLMEKQPSPLLSRIVVGFAALLMFGAAIGIFIFCGSYVRTLSRKASSILILPPALCDLPRHLRWRAFYADMEKNSGTVSGGLGGPVECFRRR